ncbi:L-threonine dehydrogenase [Oceanidesulfovibrio indonesiensis]|uniref:L-threonine dehydrogenase n=1 Tax=Oceanidesulfovibrio indonesiensis TaxID=54767 RepID=A0A7M3MFJ0_9BACT|nr:iron-containing alcohol dehydrogenase [Oceanidesulfovibrio indonesiensis]TVM17885.1 L-threonine dehydrogenase [Oceanidesulfovibrio indonesiensis]
MSVREQVYGFFIPNVTLIGIGAAKEIPGKIKDLGGKKPLIVTDKGIVGAGILKQITDLMDDAGMQYAVYDETIPNPTDENVHKGVDIYKENKCDSLITLGGGSSHDCGKGIGLVVSNGGKIHDYEGIDKSTKPLPPYVAVNTTAGTASEMTRFCIITDLSRKVKMAIVDWRVTPNIALDDPLLMVGMPPALTAATGMDALTHAVEAYVSTIATPMTDACAEKAIELVFKHLRAAVANGQDIEAREGMCFAQYLAGMAFNNASLGHVHAMAHQLGGFYDLPHGECNAILLPHVEKFNLIAKVDRFAKMAEIMGANIAGMSKRDAAEVALDEIKRLSTDIGIPAGLVELGKRYGKQVKFEDIAIMTANAQKDACGFTNPRCPKDEDVAAIYEAAM